MARPTKINFSKNLKRLMDEFELEGKALADRMKVAPETVSRWRSGKSAPSFEDLDRLARVFKVPVYRLFEDPTEPSTTGGMDPQTALRVLEELVRKEQLP